MGKEYVDEESLVNVLVDAASDVLSLDCFEEKTLLKLRGMLQTLDV